MVEPLIDYENSVLIIGNSPNVLGKSKGSEIDKFGTVIRCTSFLLEGFEEDLGTKTDIWSVTVQQDLYTYQKCVDERMEDIDTFDEIWTTEDFKVGEPWVYDWYDYKGLIRSISLIFPNANGWCFKDGEFYREKPILINTFDDGILLDTPFVKIQAPSRRVTIRTLNLSTGMHTILESISRWRGKKDLYITGFDFFESKSDYYTDIVNSVFKENAHHGEVERLIVDQYIENDILRWF